VHDETIYAALNMHWEALTFRLPAAPQGTRWHVFANTGCPAPDDIHEPGDEPALVHEGSMLIGERSVVVLVAR
jgi:glycogen operon protein